MSWSRLRELQNRARNEGHRTGSSTPLRHEAKRILLDLVDNGDRVRINSNVYPHEAFQEGEVVPITAVDDLNDFQWILGDDYWWLDWIYISPVANGICRTCSNVCVVVDKEDCPFYEEYEERM